MNTGRNNGPVVQRKITAEFPCGFFPPGTGTGKDHQIARTPNRECGNFPWLLSQCPQQSGARPKLSYAMKRNKVCKYRAVVRDAQKCGFLELELWVFPFCHPNQNPTHAVSHHANRIRAGKFDELLSKFFERKISPGVISEAFHTRESAFAQAFFHSPQPPGSTP